MTLTAKLLMRIRDQVGAVGQVIVGQLITLTVDMQTLAVSVRLSGVEP